MVKPATNSAPVVWQDREASEAQPVNCPAEVQKGVADNTKDTVDVPATYLDNIYPGSFTAGVNCDSIRILRRRCSIALSWKASDKAPWSDNGSAKTFLPPVEKLGKGLYFYEGFQAGKANQIKSFLTSWKQNGTFKVISYY